MPFVSFPPHLFLSTAGQSYLKGLGVSAENPSDTFLTLGSVAVSKVVHLLLQNMEMSKKIESITVSEPNDYILNSPPQHVGVEDPHVRALPQGLQDIVGKIFTFRCSVTSRRFNSHGMVEENRGEAALLRARPVVLEMTAEKPTVTEDGHSVKKARVE
ncbi:hypothetical protein F2Q68_00038545 [Brassica cretica]|uniref:Uncharacterized protein n=1 Tax=Brassica cretica TaxID=69181 RepID=A0A8S9MGC1_BRACR|nr:hypothetical protein F2Q68_00038545 [Brassica cretica]